MLGRPRARELERVAQDPIHAAAGEDARLQDDLLLGALVAPAAQSRVLALRVLAHDDEIDVARQAVGKGGSDARHHPDRADVGVLLKAAAKLDQEAPERDVVRHRGEAHGTQEDGVVVADLFDAVLRHHPPVLGVVVAAPGQLVPLELDAELAARRLQHPDAFRHHLFADAVTGDDGDLVLGHEQLP